MASKEETGDDAVVAKDKERASTEWPLAQSLTVGEDGHISAAIPDPSSKESKGELSAALSKRRAVLEYAAQTFESSPEESTADAVSHHLQGVCFDAEPVDVWLQTVLDPEEDRTAEFFSEGFKSRGPLPAHAPLTNETAEQLQSVMDNIRAARAKLQKEKESFGNEREYLMRREAELKAKENALEFERARVEQNQVANADYPRPNWLTHIDGTINVGVVGNSGVGKSLLINRFRGLQPGMVGWASVGVKETTKRIAMYAFPGERRVRLWDFPGAGTKLFPKETYIQDMGLRYLDKVVVVTAGRFTEMEVCLIAELRRFSVPHVLVRTKVDIDVWNNKADNDVEESRTLSVIAEDITKSSGEAPAYLVSLRDTGAYDFPTLLADVFPCLARSKGEQLGGEWDDAWSLPIALPRTLSLIQGRWRDNSCDYYISGTQVHVSRDNASALVTIEEDPQGNIWWNQGWWINLASAGQAKTTGQLRWSPIDLNLFKPLVWNWMD